MTNKDKDALNAQDAQRSSEEAAPSEAEQKPFAPPAEKPAAEADVPAVDEIFARTKAKTASERPEKKHRLSRKAKSLVILGAIAVCVGLTVLAVFLLLPEKETEAAETPVTVPLIDAKTEDVQSVTVKNAGGSYTVQVNGDPETASLAGIDSGVPVVQSRVSSTVTKAAALSSQEELPLELVDQTPSDFGFDSAAVITVKLEDGSSQGIEIGMETPLSDGYYARAVGSDDIYTVATTVGKLASYGISYYVNTTLSSSVTTENTTDIENIQVEGKLRGETLRIEQKEDSDKTLNNYRTTSPKRYDVDSDKLDSLFFQTLESFTATGVASLDVGAASLASFGLDDPNYVFSFTITGATERFLFGNINDNSEFYVMKDGIPVVYTISAASVAFLDTQIPDIVSSLIFLKYIDTVETLTIASPTKSYEFRLSGENDDLTIEYNGNELPLESFRTLYQLAIGISLQGEAAEPENGEVVAKITYTTRDSDQTDIVEYVNIDGRKCFARVNGDGMFYAMRADVEKLLNACETYVSGGEIED